MYRICQESLANIANHASAENARVCLDITGGRATLIVRDDGKGFNPANVTVHNNGDEHFGLRGMQNAPVLWEARSTSLADLMPAPPSSSTSPSSPANQPAHHPPDQHPTNHVPIRILIADDHAVVRRGLILVLRQQADFEIVGEARNGEEAYSMVFDVVPDVALLDWKMPQMDGITAARNIRRDMALTKTLIFVGCATRR